MNCTQDHLGPSGPLGRNSSFSFIVMPWRQVQACLRQNCFQLNNEHAQVRDGIFDAWLLWSVRVLFFLFSLVLVCGRSLLWPSNSRICLCRQIGRTRHRACRRVGINLIMLDVVGLPPRMIAILLCACIKETQAGLAKPLSGKVNATHSMESGLEKRRIPDRPGPDALKENENSNKLSFRKTFWLRPSKP